jgi:glutamate decarboxylase
MSSIASRIIELFRPPEQARDVGDLPLPPSAGRLRRPVAVTSAVPPERLLEQYLSTDIPESPLSLAGFMDTKIRDLVDHSTNVGSPRCLGHMSGALPPYVRDLNGLLLCLNQNLVKADASKSLTLVERQAIAMLHRAVFRGDPASYAHHLRSPSSALGVMVSGGTTANITALWSARNACLAAPAGNGDLGVRTGGLAHALKRRGYRGAVVLASVLAHYSVVKAAELLGLGARQVARLPVDGCGRMRTDALRRAFRACRRRRDRVVAVVGTAGTTDCGSIDPLDEIADVAAAEGSHFHVDAAWGGPLLLSDRHRHLLAGVERADTVTLDGHKQLHLPLGTSLVLFREPGLAHGLEHEADYMLRRDSFDQGRYTLEGSRAGAVLFLHAALHLIGREGFGFLVDNNFARARQFADMIAASEDFDLLHEPETNLVLYRYLPRPCRAPARRDDTAAMNEFNSRLQQLQANRGKTYVSRTRVRYLPRFAGDAVVALRAVICNPLITRDDLQAVLVDQRELAAELERQGDWHDPQR